MAFDYTDSDIREELARLGYHDLTEDQLRAFKKQLMKLMQEDRSRQSPQTNVATVTDTVKDTVGNGRNHGNQAIQKNSWKEISDESVSSPYPRPMNDFSRKLPADNMAGEFDKRLDVASNQRVYTRSPNLTSVYSESSLKPKLVNWKPFRKGTVMDYIAGDATWECYGLKDRSGHVGENEFWARMYGQSRRLEAEGVGRQTSSANEPRDKKKNVSKNISGIISHKEHPHTRNLYRTKPFERHQMYLRAWRTQPPVGEASRNSVIWQVHKRLLKKEEIKFRQKTLTPNSYVVPTTKPRYELRWAVRQCNENYEKPPCGFFHEV